MLNASSGHKMHMASLAAEVSDMNERRGLSAVRTEQAEELVRNKPHRKQQRGEDDVACTRTHTVRSSTMLEQQLHCSSSHNTLPNPTRMPLDPETTGSSSRQHRISARIMHIHGIREQLFT